LKDRRRDYMDQAPMLAGSVEEAGAAAGAVKQYQSALQKVLVDCKEFQDRLTERAGKERGALEHALLRATSVDAWVSAAAVPATDARELLIPVATVDGQARRAPRLTARARQPAELIDRLFGAEPWSGALYWEGGQPVKLSGRVGGRAVLVCPAGSDVELSDVTSGGGGLVVVSFGRLALRGPVQAAIVAAGTLELSSPTITGTLLICKKPVAPRGVEKLLEGDVRADAAQRTGDGPLPKQLAVLLAPVPLRDEVAVLP
jgi:hypothetical protein